MSKNMFCDKKDLTNEDSVEKFFIDRLIKKLNFKDSEIKTKKSIKELTISKGRRKEQYKPDYVLYKGNKPRIIIDAKSVSEKIDDYHYQVSGYALLLNQDYDTEDPVQVTLLSNGLVTKVYKWNSKKEIFSISFEDFTESNDKYKRIVDLLSNLDMKEKIAKNTFAFVQSPASEIDGVFKACHNLIWKKEQISPTDAFYEFCKLFFIKIKQDKELHAKFVDHGIEIPIDEFKFSENWIEKQDAKNPVNDILFKQRLLPFLKDEREKYGKRRIFEDDENINLTSSTILEVVKLLEHRDFYGIDEDLNGRMFEAFLSATVRGKDLGQFFTPRNVVKFIVKMADIKVSKDHTKIQTVFDGCCGSGGFLIDAMAEMVSKVNAIQSITQDEKKELHKEIYQNKIYGSEINVKNSRVSRMNLWFHGDGSSNVYCLNTLDKNFSYDSSLSEERIKEIEFFKKKIRQGLRFDIILTNPPFSTAYEWKKPDERKIIEEYEISWKDNNKEQNKRATSLKSNVLFIERYLDLLSDKGKLITVIDESVLNAEKEKNYRDFILANFIVKAVISLPRNAFVNADTITKTSVLYLRKKSNPLEKQGPIFMAISQNVGHSDSGRPEPEKCDLWKILKEFEKFENGT